MQEGVGGVFQVENDAIKHGIEKTPTYYVNAFVNGSAHSQIYLLNK